MGSARVRFSNTGIAPLKLLKDVPLHATDSAIDMVLYNSLQVELGFFSYHPLHD